MICFADFQEKNEGCPRGEGTSPLEKNVIDIIYHFIRDEMQITPINHNLFYHITAILSIPILLYNLPFLSNVAHF